MLGNSKKITYFFLCQVPLFLQIPKCALGLSDLLLTFLYTGIQMFLIHTAPADSEYTPNHRPRSKTKKHSSRKIPAADQAKTAKHQGKTGQNPGEHSRRLQIIPGIHQAAQLISGFICLIHRFLFPFL